MCMGKVLVNLDLRKGLAEDIMIEWSNRFFREPLDYMRVPFLCNPCHYYGHVITQCDLLKKIPQDYKFAKMWRVKKDLVVHVADPLCFK